MRLGKIKLEILVKCVTLYYSIVKMKFFKTDNLKLYETCQQCDIKQPLHR